MSSDVVIIGAGITGCAAAYELARAGASVHVVDRRNIGTMGSGRTLAGVRQSGRHRDELPLAIEAVRRWETLHLELDADLEYRQHGNLRLAEDESDTHVISQMVQEHQNLGLDVRYLDGNAAVRDVAPALSETIQAASFTPTDGHANPILTVQAYARAAQRLGVQFSLEQDVSRITTHNGKVAGVVTTQERITADCVVVAAGIESPAILHTAELDLPISLSMVPVVQTVEIEPILDQVLGTAKAHFAARQEVDGKMRFSSGGRPISLSSDSIDHAAMQPGCTRLAETLSRATKIIPRLEEVPVNQVWGGLVDLTTDGLPVLDRVDEPEGLVIAAGFCGHGFCLGPVTGGIVRDLVLGNETGFAMEPFRWGRLVTGEETTRAELLG